MGEFSDRLGEIASGMAVGPLEGHVEVDQVYAHYQHEGICRFCGRPLVYHRGGEDHFIEKPLMEFFTDYYQRVADRLLEPEGDGAQEAMIDNMRHLAGEVSLRTPLENDVLRNSVHVWVTNDGETVWDQPARMHRLSDDELRALDRENGGHLYGHHH